MKLELWDFRREAVNALRKNLVDGVRRYESKLIKYTKKHWRPEVAAEHTESLQRAINCLQKLIR